jgi:hypothetical protein
MSNREACQSSSRPQADQLLLCSQKTSNFDSPTLSDTLLNYLQSCRKGRDKPIKTRQKKMTVPPERSVSLADIEETDLQSAGSNGRKRKTALSVSTP